MSETTHKVREVALSFSDSHFNSYLAENFDTNKDDEISQYEALLDCSLIGSAELETLYFGKKFYIDGI